MSVPQKRRENAVIFEDEIFEIFSFKIKECIKGCTTRARPPQPGKWVTEKQSPVAAQRTCFIFYLLLPSSQVEFNYCARSLSSVSGFKRPVSLFFKAFPFF